jgi:fatty-acyl-CoA synthase
VFLRLSDAIAVTGTFKHRKIDLVADGFDPAKIKGPLYARVGDAYQPVTREIAGKIAAGELRL